MTNERLAELIREGGNDELLPILWDKTRLLIFKKCGTIRRFYSEKLERFGYSLENLQQESYNALIFAVKGCKAEKGLLELCLKTHCARSAEWRLGRSQPGRNAKS